MRTQLYLPREAEIKVISSCSQLSATFRANIDQKKLAMNLIHEPSEIKIKILKGCQL